MNEEFLGRGWSFPPSFSLESAGVTMVQYEEDVASSLRILLGTMRGERVMLPTYGCALDGLLFEPLDVRQKTLMADLVESAILYHEPRVAVEAVALSKEDDLEGLVMIEVVYRVKATNSRFNLVFPFYAQEGTDVNIASTLRQLGEAH